MVNHLLVLKNLVGSHTGVTLNEFLTEQLLKWELQLKVTTVTTDAAANQQLAIRLNPYLEWINCFAHMLNLVVRNAFCDYRIQGKSKLMRE